MNVLVTGASGFIGSALLPALRAAGHGVRCWVGDVVEMAQGRDPGPLVHLAAATLGAWRTNVLGTAAVCGVLSSGARLIFASALTAGCPHDQYDREKALGEQIVRARKDISPVILRLGNVYGPGPQSKRCTLNALMRQAVEGETLHVYGNARGCRDYVHVDDVVRAFLLALEAPPGIYDVGTAVPTTLYAAVQLIAGQAGVPIEVAPDAHALHHATAREDRWLLGWAPMIGLEVGIAQTLEWLRAQRAAVSEAAV